VTHAPLKSVAPAGASAVIRTGTLAIAGSPITIDPSMAAYSFGLLIHDTITAYANPDDNWANRRWAFAGAD
jgi:hypothetical protein